MLASILSDVRFALRLVRRGPAFYGMLVLVLAAGIGATTAMFSIARSLFFQPLPYPHPEELTMVWRTDPRFDNGPSSIPDFVNLQARSSSFAYLSATGYTGISFSSPGKKPESFQGACVSGDFFAVMGVEPLAGRFLRPDDDRPGAPRVVVLSASMWHERFASDTGVLGKTVMLDSQPYTVVGVAPEGFRFSGPYTDRTDLWTPLATGLGRYPVEVHERGDNFLHVVGRRKPGVTLEQAQAEASSIAKSLKAQYPDTNTNKGLRLVDLHEELVGGARSSVWILFGAIVLVFGIVCANVASLLFTRAQSRRGEMATRAALGAPAARLLQQVVTETAVVFLLGGAAGAALSRWLVGFFASGVLTAPGARLIDIRVDAGALAFTFGACLAAGLVFGLVPAWGVARVEPQSALKEGAARASASRSQRLLRSALVVAQIAVAFALTVGSGLALQAFGTLASTPPGFDPDGLATMRIVIPESKYDDATKTENFYMAVIRALEARPDVTSVSGDSELPMAGSNSSGSFEVEGRPKFAPAERPVLERNVVTPGYFRTMATPLLSGREFTKGDVRDGRHVMVISKAAAERFFPGQDPIGHRIDLEEGSDGSPVNWREIVGVVGDVRRRGLGSKVEAECYTPLAQDQTHWMAVVARSPRAEALLQDIPGIVAQIDPDQSVADRRLMAARVASSVGNQRYVAFLLLAFAAAALVLSTLGIFGIVSYNTLQRTRELGIRMALGSTPAGVVMLVLKDGMRLVGVGLALGVFGAAIVARVVSNEVGGVHLFAPLIYATILATLVAAGLVACLLPALRAVRIPPALALRYE